MECEILANHSQPDYVVFIFHGFGANAEDLKSIADAFLKAAKDQVKIRFVLPEGLVSLGPQQSCWWPLDLQKLLMALQTHDVSMLSDEPFGISNVRDKVSALVQEVALECKTWNSEFNISKNVIFAGFSQGAMLAVDLSLFLTEIPKALVIFSGGICCKEHWESKVSKLKNIPVFQSHGLADPILPFEVGKMLNTILVNGGTSLDGLHSFEGGHHIPAEILEKYIHFLHQQTK